ncbi:MAG: Dyp-type peroxidase [Solirubrobacteraceae bacterium]
MGAADTAQHVLAPPAKAALFLTVTVRAGREKGVREALGDVAGIIRAVGFRVPEAKLSCVIGIGAEAWDRLYATKRPAGLHPFRPLHGARHTAVATPGDLLFHIRAARQDLCFELGRQLMLRCADLVDVADEVHGFRYWDERDLLGFVDGTESPTERPVAEAVALVADDPVYTGASYVIVQKYLHDLDAWETLTVEQQELIIGRRKLSDIELPDALKPPDSHVALNTVTDNGGTERKILRDNMPFGSVGGGDLGTYFIGYAADPTVTEQMLQNMFLGRGSASHDRILDFSRAVTGCLFFVPPRAFLEDPAPFLAAHCGTATDGSAPSGQQPPYEGGSLGIGNLGRSTLRSGAL